MTLRLNLVHLAWDQVTGSTNYEIQLDGVKVAMAGPKAKTTKITIPEGAEHRVTIKALPSGDVQEARFEWSSIAVAPPPPPPPPPPPSTDFQNERMLLMAANEVDNPTSWAHYGMVEFACYRTADAATLKSLNANVKIVMYKAPADMRDIGTGATMPTQALRFAWDSGILYNEALVHDQANPGDKWILTTDGSTPISNFYGYTGIYGGNIAKTSFRQKWVANVLEQLHAQTEWNGVFIDNVVINTSTSVGNGWPYELPTQTAWTNAMLGFIEYVAGALRAEGYLFGCNANYWVGGDGSSDSGVGTIGWWQQLAPYVDYLYSEYGLNKATDTSWVRKVGTNWYDYWDNWSTLVGVAQNAGCMGIIQANPPAGVVSSAQVRFIRATTLLYWNGSGLCTGFNGADTSSDVWQAPLNIELGQPVAAQTVENGGHKRQFQNGWVAVNPTYSTVTMNVGGTNRQIASGDAYIGA